MTTLEDAWGWYQAIRQGLQRLKRLSIHWDSLPWDGHLGQDDLLRETHTDQLRALAETGRTPLDDLAIVVLFSVFEAGVREAVLAEIKPEVERLQHPALRRAAIDVQEAVGQGSFFRVLDPFKLEGHADLVEQINQVRRYRNWVAHGRRGQPPASVTPEAAYDRLRRFLDLIGPLAP